ncbi:MAG: endonuclease III [Ruminococcus sp.]|nr:endonuclease III [Ruminococcus sp.]
MTKKERAALAEDALEKLYPDAVCTLDYEKPYELLFATRLAAQCTDARVNIVTQTLFTKYPTLESFAEADLAELEQDVRPCGFFRTKARSLRETAQRLISDFGGEVPGTMEELLSLPGVGRKTANLILGDVFGKPAVVTDTHCIRIAGRLGLTAETEPSKVERDLRKLLDPEKSNLFCHRIVFFGRDICRARSPKCGECPLAEICRHHADETKRRK